MKVSHYLHNGWEKIIEIIHGQWSTGTMAYQGSTYGIDCILHSNPKWPKGPKGMTGQDSPWRRWWSSQESVSRIRVKERVEIQRVFNCADITVIKAINACYYDLRQGLRSPEGTFIHSQRAQSTLRINYSTRLPCIEEKSKERKRGGYDSTHLRTPVYDQRLLSFDPNLLTLLRTWVLARSS